MDKQIATEEAMDMTEIEERIEDQKSQTVLLQKQLQCECPSTDCQVEHES
jgi:hypothetical protein